jgi:hypothetical protein
MSLVRHAPNYKYPSVALLSALDKNRIITSCRYGKHSEELIEFGPGHGDAGDSKDIRLDSRDSPNDERWSYQQ